MADDRTTFQGVIRLDNGVIIAPEEDVVDAPASLDAPRVIVAPEETIADAPTTRVVVAPEEDIVSNAPEQPRSMLDSVLHGTRVMGAGLVDAALFPSKLIAPVVSAAIGDNALSRGNEAWDKTLEDFVGKSSKDYNIAENMLHFGGQLIPTPGMAAPAARTGVSIAQRVLEAATPLIPARGLTTTTMGANVALPTAIVEGVDALTGEREQRSNNRVVPVDNGTSNIPGPSSPQRTSLVDRSKWLEENKEYLLAAPLALATRGKYRKALGIEGRPPVNEVGAVAKTERALFDANAPLKNLLTPEQVIRIEGTIPPSSMSARIMFAAKTAIMPSSEVRLQHIPAGMLQAWGKLPDDLRSSINTALRAADDLDSRSLGGASIFPGQTAAQLRGIIARARSNPVAARWMDAHKQTMHDVLDYMRERGLLTADKHTELLTTQSNYVSRIGALIKDRSLGAAPGRVVEALLSAEQKHDTGLNTIQQLAHRGAQTGDTAETLVDVGTALEQVIANTIRLAETNSIRRRALRTLEHVAMSNGKPYAEAVKRAEDSNVSVLVNGVRKYYNVADPTIAEVIQFSPQHTHLLVNEVRHLFQMATTGPIGDGLSMAFTGLPLQSIANAFYESFGILGQAYKQSKFNPIDAVLALPVGVGVAVKGRVTELLARNAEEALLLGTPASKTLSQQAVRDAADAYARTIAGTLERNGGVLTGTTTSREFDTMRSLAANYAPTFYRQTHGSYVPDPVRAVWSQWLWAHDSVQLAWKYHYALRNMPGGASRASEQRIANEVARVTGDFRQKGEPNSVVSLLRDATPYGNVALQSMYAWVRGWRNNPTRMFSFLTGTALASAGLITHQMIDNPELAHFYWNVLTPEQRAQGIPVWEDKNNPAAVQFITYPHEPRPLLAAANEAFGTAIGFKDGSIYNQPDVLAALSEMFNKPWTRDDTTELRSAATGAIGTIVGDAPLGGGIPGAILGAGGYRWSADRGLVEAPDSRQELQPGYEFTNDPRKRWVYDTVRSATGMAGQLAIALDRGFNAVTGDASMFERAENAYEHGQQVYGPRAQRLTGLLGMDHRITTMTTTFKHLQPKAEKIDGIQKIIAELATGGTRTNVDAKVGKQLDVPHDAKISAEAAIVARSVPPALLRQWSETKQKRAQIYEMRDKIQNHGAISAQEKARLTNEYNRAINTYNAQLLITATDMERFVSARLKKPFRFDDLSVRQ